MPFALPRAVLATMMMIMGLLHFTHGPLFVSIMPAYLPYPLELVYLSGVFEIALGAMLLSERTRVLAGWGLVALYVAVFPANIHFALHPDLTLVGKPDWMPQPAAWLAWARLPFQAVFIYWAYACTRTKEQPSKTTSYDGLRA